VDIPQVFSFELFRGRRDTAEEWLEEFSVFSIYQVLPEIISLWGVNLETQSEAKKNGMPSTGK
jgi:hypothetical protein